MSLDESRIDEGLRARILALTEGEDDTVALFAVFDIDSDQPDAFTEDDAAMLSGILDAVFGSRA